LHDFRTALATGKQMAGTAWEEEASRCVVRQGMMRRQHQKLDQMADAPRDLERGMGDE